MALLKVKDVLFDASLVAFDKDGTLIDFEFMWGRLARTWADDLAAGMNGESLRPDLFRSWGYDPEQRRTRPASPFAIASTGQLQTIAAVTLYRHGVPWPEAEDRARSAVQGAQSRAGLTLADLVQPAGNVEGLLQRLKGAGASVAVVTSDHRAATEETLAILGVASLVDITICGDDGLPNKPAPDMLLAVYERLGIAAARTVVVGDTEGDLLMAQRASAGLKVAVLTGPGDPAVLKRHADVVIPSIDGIAVVSSGSDS